MFWSKIWFFLVAVAAAIALTIALVLPRPAARALVREEHSRLTVACGVVGILLADDARKRVDLAGSFARTDDIMKALDAASAAQAIDEARAKQVRATAETVMKTITGDRKPDFAMLIDKKGRVVTRVRLDEAVFGDLAAGRPLVDDALDGYLGDDLWAMNGTLYFVSASPVVKAPDYLGAVVLGHQVTNELAQKLVGSLGVDVGFYLADNAVASSRAIALDQATMRGSVGKLSGDPARDCNATPPFPLRAGNDELTAIVARLPGEAAAKKAYYAVFVDRPVGRGFMATLGAVRKDDLGFSNFPWIPVAGGFLLALGVGIALMLIEADRPLRRLAAETVRLAKGEAEKLSEDAHPGKFGSIARSVNIHLDKVVREAKASKVGNLDQLLGPAPEGSLGTIDLLATALPAARPGGSAPIVPPPPSEFRFTDSGKQPALARPGVPPAMPPVPVPASASGPAIPVSTSGASIPVSVPISSSVSQPAIPSISIPAAASPLPAPVAAQHDDIYFRQIFDQFLAVKHSCNETMAGLTYEKFAEKLIRNRDELRARTGCRDVRFTVYVKDGKAALKASPVRDE